MKVVRSVPTIFTSRPASFTSVTSQVTTPPFLRSPAPSAANGSPSSCLMPSEMRSFSTSTSSTCARTLSPFLKSSMTCSPGRFQSRSERWTMPSTSPSSPRNRPNSVLFLGLDGDVDGMVHLSDLDWKRPGEQVIDEFKKGEKVKAQVLDVDVEKERISLGIKQLEGDPFAEASELRKGAVVTCEVTEVKEGGIDVKIVGSDLTAFIRRADLARDRADQRPERFQVGQKVDAR